MGKTKDFSNPKKLGFMRVLQVVFSIHIVLEIMALTLLSKEYWALGFDSVLSLVDLLFEAVTLYLIAGRKQHTREIVMGLAAVNIAVGVIHYVSIGQFNAMIQVVSSASDIVLFLYFALSRRVKAIMVQPFSMEEAGRSYEEARGFFKLRTLQFWRNIVIYYCVFSVVGHWMEAAYCLTIKYGIMPGTYDPNSQIWSDWLYPFPVYGCGFLACVLLLSPVRFWLQKHIKNVFVALAASFVVNAAVCGAIELVMGLMLNQPDPVTGVKPLWDYSDMAFNFMGQICLLNTCAFGLVATLMTWAVYPALERFLNRLPKDVMRILFICVVVGYAILMALYYVNVSIPSVAV